MEINYWSDYACPFCYIGEVQLKEAIRRLGMENSITLRMRAFQLDPNAPLTPETKTVERYAHKYGISVDEARKRIGDIDAMGRDLGLEFNYADAQFTNTMDAHRLTKLAQALGNKEVTDKLITGLFDAYFCSALPLADKDVLREIAGKAGLPEKETDDVLSSDKYFEAVRKDELDAARLQITSVPFFIIGRLGIPGAVSTDTFIHAIEAAAEGAAEKKETGHICGPDGCAIG